jgi:hypothetical protein
MTETFASAATSFADLVRAIPTDDYDGPGLGVWDLRSLVGHASRSLITVDTYLDRPAASEQLATPEAYVAAAARMVAADADAVAERGRQAGIALGPEPARAVRTLLNRVLPRVAAAADPLIETIAGGMRLSSYLPTRTFELVVHSLDIAHATGLPAPRWSESVLAEVATVASRAAVLEGRGAELVLALTGRGPLPDGFSVV